MADWRRFEKEAGDLASAVRARFEAAKHHVLATSRADGSPRVSGTEVEFRGSDLTLGSMLGSVKAKDLLRDGRFALHANPGDASMEGGDAKLSGRAVEVTGPQAPGDYHLFRLELDEVVLTEVDEEAGALMIRLWRAGRPLARFERRNEDPVPKRLEG